MLPRFFPRLLCCLPLCVPAWARGADFFDPQQSARTFDHRTYQWHEAGIDLDAADLAIACAPAATLASELSKSDETPRLLALPVGSGDGGPLVHQGQWLLLPQGRWSAVGFTAGHHPVFASSWLAEAPPTLARAELDLSDGRHFPLGVNETAPGADATLFTRDFASQIAAFDASAFWCSLLLQSPRETNLSAARGPAEQLVLSTDNPRQKYFLSSPDQSVVVAFDPTARALRASLQRNARVRISLTADEDWRDVHEAIPLGAPLIWKGEAVNNVGQPSSAVPSGKTARADFDLSAPAHPVLAWFPRKNSLAIVWTQPDWSRGDPASRRLVAGQLLAQGAEYALEFAKDAPPLLTSQMEPAKYGALLDAANGPMLAIARAANTDEVNLCRLPGVDATASPLHTAAPGLIDGNYGESLWPECAWEAAAGQPGAESGQNSWVEIDLNQAAKVSRVEIVHAQALGFSAQFNTADFRVLGKEYPADAWDQLAQVNGNQTQRTVIRLSQPRSLRYLRIEIQRPNAFDNDPVARLAEVEVWGKQ